MRQTAEIHGGTEAGSTHNSKNVGGRKVNPEVAKAMHQQVTVHKSESIKIDGGKLKFDDGDNSKSLSLLKDRRP